MSVGEPIDSRERRGFVGTALVALAALFARTREAAAGQVRTSRTPVQMGRRVVTGKDPQGRSRIETEAPVPGSATRNDNGAQGMD